MSILIAPEDIRKGDKLRVTYETADVERQVTGVADRHGNVGQYWYTANNAILVNTGRRNQKVFLVQRAKTAEEILKERRDLIAADYCWVSYDNVSGSMRQAIDRIIALENEKEALTK